MIVDYLFKIAENSSYFADYGSKKLYLDKKKFYLFLRACKKTLQATELCFTLHDISMSFQRLHIE